MQTQNPRSVPQPTIMEQFTTDSDFRVGRRPGRRESAVGDMAGVDMLLHADDGQGTRPEEIHTAPAPLSMHRRQIIESTNTAPVAIPMSREQSRSRSKARTMRDVAMVEPSQNSKNDSGKHRRRRKKGGKKNVPPVPVTPQKFGNALLSGDEESNFSPAIFKRRDISTERSSIASSPFMRPVSSGQGGISTLRNQLETLDLQSSPRLPPMIRTQSDMSTTGMTSDTMNSGSGSETDIDGPEMTSYQVPFDEDFVSAEAKEEENTPGPTGMLLEHVHRKMSAHDFTPVTCLGKGSFGTVTLVRQQATGKLFAQKMFRKASMVVQKSLIEQTKTERSILESINRHPFVVKLYYAFQDHEKLYLILEYAQGGELFTHLAAEKMFPEETASFYMAELVLALEHLHNNVGVVYRDLKPENCLLDAEGHLLLTDFGLSKVSEGEWDRCSSFLGTIEYMAPEVIQGHMYGTVVDWWSFGALGYDLLTGSPPFRGNNHKKIQDNILKSKLTLPYFLSPDAKDLLTRLLRKEPTKRLGHNMPKDMKTIKSHRFFRKIDWKRLEKRELEPPIQPIVTDPELAENFSSEFTTMALSPVASTKNPFVAEEHNPFGGFSFVASKSMLVSEGFL